MKSSIPRLSFRSERAEAYALMRDNRPFLLTDAMEGWRARDWTFASLCRDFGEHEVHAKPLPTRGRGRPRYRRMTLAAYLDVIGSSAGKLWSTAQLRHPAPRVLAGVDFRRDVLPPESASARRGHWIFVGRDSYTRLHYHPGTQALLAQLHGAKRLQFYPPQATPSLYPYPWYSFGHNGSSVEDHLGETPEFPRFARVRPLVVEVRAGEMLFVPVHWWHDGQSSGESITATVFWRAPLSRWSFPTPGLRDLAHAALYAPVMLFERLRQRRLSQPSRARSATQSTTG